MNLKGQKRLQVLSTKVFLRQKTAGQKGGGILIVLDFATMGDNRRTGKRLSAFIHGGYGNCRNFQHRHRVFLQVVLYTPGLSSQGQLPLFSGGISGGGSFKNCLEKVILLSFGMS